jgi:antitoxin (DNA-binding transcriptional repressor) of toxin-antitoxin stability system
MAIQILFWFVSGLFFAIAPIEQVRSEHMKAATPPAPIAISVAAAGLQRIAGAEPGERIEIRSMLGRPVALVVPHEGRPRLYDLASGSQLSPVPQALAVRIAEADHVGDLRAANVSLVTEESPEYRAALPAWRIDFDDGGNRALYVAQDTGQVTARRSTLWRVFDFLWSLHIMDFQNHEDFNTPLLIVATALGLIVIVTGIVMFPSRLGYNAWKRRRRSAAPKADVG